MLQLLRLLHYKRDFGGGGTSAKELQAIAEATEKARAEAKAEVARRAVKVGALDEKLTRLEQQLSAEPPAGA